MAFPGASDTSCVGGDSNPHPHPRLSVQASHCWRFILNGGRVGVSRTVRAGQGAPTPAAGGWDSGSQARKGAHNCPQSTSLQQEVSTLPSPPSPTASRERAFSCVQTTQVGTRPWTSSCQRGFSCGPLGASGPLMRQRARLDLHSCAKDLKGTQPKGRA